MSKKRAVPATDKAIAEAAKILRGGGLVGFPTETVYGLGADARNSRAVAGIFSAKGRPLYNPLIVHVADRQWAEEIAVFSAEAHRLAETFWPGPMTLVLPARDSNRIADIAVAGLNTVALRVPRHPVACALVREAECPIVAPSANRSGRVSATQALHVAADFGANVDIILDAGACQHGLESTIVAVLQGGLSILRKGAVTEGELEQCLGYCPGGGGELAASKAPLAPGQLASHYAPGAPVRLDVNYPNPGEAFLAFGKFTPHGPGLTVNLSPSGDLAEAAANLFAALRELDRPGVSAIAVMPIPDHGLGAAINDRLRRAAAPRPP
ncbi:MAG: L-threonylcarbamoyladenylate synthase [Hyphomicrobiaceae bacterium]